MMPCEEEILGADDMLGKTKQRRLHRGVSCLLVVCMTGRAKRWMEIMGAVT